MSQIAIGILFASALLVGMVALMELGRRLGGRRARQDEENARAGLGAIEGAVFALMGLLIAFTFTGAAARFDVRRDLIVEEVNSIGTAWLRLDVVEPRARAAMRDLFRRYVDERLETYRHVRDVDRALAMWTQSQATQQRIWDAAMAAVQAEPAKPITMILLPALNQMFDIATTRILATRMHPPALIFIMLASMALLASLMAGYGMSRGRRSWTHIIVFSLVMAGSVYIILDMEFPRLGMIRVDSFDQALFELRRSMDAPAVAPAPGTAPTPASAG